MRKVPYNYLKANVILLMAVIFTLLACEKEESNIKSIQGDLSIRYIQRLPEIDYVWNSNNPDIDGWPAENQEVTWSAHVLNTSGKNLQDVSYSWILDGAEVKHEKVDILANSETLIDYNMSWTFSRHKLELVIDTLKEIEELEERNNSLEVYTDALSIGFYVEQSFYDYFLEHQYELGIGSFTFDDWAHRHIASMNKMFSEAVYPMTPDGVLDRMRIDKITIVPDGTLPLVSLDTVSQPDARPGTHPNLNDRSVDMLWGFVSEHTVWYNDHNTVSTTNPFYFQGSLLHELGHARYLTDVYGFNLYHGIQGNAVLIEEDGEPIAGSAYLPGTVIHFGDEEGLILYSTEIHGLMNQDYDYIDEYSAILLNRIEGHRAVTGNFNIPFNHGCYFNDLPLENKVTIRSKDGTLCTNASIDIYQSAGVPGASSFYTKLIDNVPDIHLISDDQGVVSLGNNPFCDGPLKHDWEISNMIAVMRVEYDGKVGYAVLDASLFNLQYWYHNEDVAHYEITVNLI